jgi:hypothetical protein
MKTVTFDETKWKIVPIEPTEEMIYELGCAIDESSSEIALVHRNVIDVAPEYKEE